MSDRASDRPTGRVFAAGAAATLLTAVACAFRLALAFRAGLDFIVMTPLLVAAPAVVLTRVTVSWSHCRNRILAGLLGLCAGSIVFLGYFHADFALDTGLDHFHRLDLLPQVVQWRMTNDVVQHDFGKPVQPVAPDPVRTVLNWSLFLTEGGLIAWIPMALAAAAAYREWRESIGCRMA